MSLLDNKQAQLFLGTDHPLLEMDIKHSDQ